MINTCSKEIVDFLLEKMNGIMYMDTKMVRNSKILRSYEPSTLSRY